LVRLVAGAGFEPITPKPEAKSSRIVLTVYSKKLLQVAQIKKVLV